MKTKITHAIIMSLILVIGATFDLTVLGNTEANSKNSTTENISENGDRLIYQGKFHNADKRGSGTASVYKKSDGTRVLRLTNFSTSSGPDLFVYFYKTRDARNSSSLKNVRHISLGRLKSQKGTQEYQIPAGVDLNSYQAISIWCRQFGVNFATAPLSGV